MPTFYLRSCLILALAVCGALLAPSVPAQDAQWSGELAAWRAQHVSDLQKPAGWLSLTGLEWLQPGDNPFGSAADNKIHLAAGSPAHLGVLHLENGTVQLLPPAGGDFPPEFLVAGGPAKKQLIPVDPDDDKSAPHLTIATLNMYVIRRADRFALRVKDSQAPALVNFHGVKWYAPDAAYHVTARWIPYSPAKTISLATLIGTTYDASVPGAAEFTLNGKTYRLEPVLEDPKATQLFFILRDTTSSSTTYHACRFLYTVLPDQGLAKPGTLSLDFNKLENPPCAYTPYATCPLPPPGNRLAIALPVGEKRYHD
ncbi:MAG: DUF1684 domain-containing protein [Candidatus Acidiferrum sp.]